MASTIRIKRRDAGGAVGAPAALLNAELAFNEADKTLYYGFGIGAGNTANSVIAIGGEGAFWSTNIVRAANTVLAGPTTGSDSAPTFRLLVADDIPTLTANKISDFDTAVQSNKLNTLTDPDGEVDLNNQKIVNLATPTQDTDAANKAYVDAARNGLDVKGSVRVATTTDITLENQQNIDGVAVVDGDRVLVKNQTIAADNGIYICKNAAPWERAPDANSNEEVTPGMFTFVEEGTTNADSGWVLTNNAVVNLGLTGLAFAQFSGAGQIIAGSGLTKTGNTIDVGGTANRITVNADSVDISANYLGQTSITTLGTVTSGTWNATTLGVAYGGTGLTSAAKGSVLVANTANTFSALDGGGSTDKVLFYNATTDEISWSNEIDGGSF
ncbi:MAG: hypothetical protein ACO24P_02090 [Candidatus Nanopelagicaceae bacterium]